MVVTVSRPFDKFFGFEILEWDLSNKWDGEREVVDGCFSSFRSKFISNRA